jgi:hypothetical protein
MIIEEYVRNSSASSNNDNTEFFPVVQYKHQGYLIFSGTFPQKHFPLGAHMN